jgi:hypothetical protein
MKIDGRCLCGHITFVAEIDPQNVRICHCNDCQVHAGSAYRTNVPATKDTFRLTGGQPKTYVKIADSGSRRAQAFCPECGTSIYSTAAEGGGLYMLRVGAMRQRSALEPKLQQWCSSALAWSLDLQAVPKFDKQPPSS